MVNTADWMRRTFSTYTANECWNSSPVNIEKENEREYLYLMVPVKGKSVEIPVFLGNEYINLIEHHEPDDIPDYMAVRLESKAKQSRYSTFDRVIRSVLNENYTDSKLVRFTGKEEEGNVYYGTKSALFDKDFNPLMLCTWQIKVENVAHTGDIPIFKRIFKKPILRIAPQFYTGKYDSVGRFVCKKMLTTLLDMSVYPPKAYYYSTKFKYTSASNCHPKVVIDSFPFEIRKVSCPSISTTSQELRKVVLDNLEDVA